MLLMYLMYLVFLLVQIRSIDASYTWLKLELETVEYNNPELF